MDPDISLPTAFDPIMKARKSALTREKHNIKHKDDEAFILQSTDKKKEVSNMKQIDNYMIELTKNMVSKSLITNAENIRLDEKDELRKEKIERNLKQQLNTNVIFKGMYNNEMSKLKDKMNEFKITTKKRLQQIKRK